MGCGKSKLDVVGNATISKSNSKSVSKKQKDEGSAQVAKDVKTVSDKVESENKVEIAVAPQQTGGGSEKIEEKTEKPEEESPVAGAGDVEAGNAGAEEELDVDKKDDSNSLKIEGEPAGATKIVFIEPVVEKPKDLAEAKAPILEEKAHVEETKTETIKEAPEIATEKEAEVVPAVEPEASTPTPPQASAAPAEETETVAVPAKPEAAEEENETEAVASPVQPEASDVPAEEKKETEEASAAAEEQEKAPAGEETVAPAAESPAADTKTD